MASRLGTCFKQRAHVKAAKARLVFDVFAISPIKEIKYLPAFAVVDAALARPENLDSEPELGELLLPLEVGVLSAFVAADPGRVPRVEHEPALAFDHEP